MTLCTPNILTKPVPTCTQGLTIGTVTSLSANLNLFIHDITTDRTERIQTTSNGAGLVVADLSDFHGMASHSYRFWITTAAGGIEDKLNITIGSETADTFGLRFTDVYENDQALWVEDQTLEVA